MTPWVLRLLLANVAIFFLIPWPSPIAQLFAFVPALILQRPWGLVSYMFLHAGFMHILFNMIGLYFFGPRLESRIGSGDFVRLYFVAGLAGALFHMMVGFGGAAVDVVPFNPWISLVGASGAVFGVLYGFAHYWPDERIYIWGILPIPSRVLVTGLAAISIWFGISGGGNVAHFAHLGGFAGGWLYLKIRERRSGAFRRKAMAGAEPSAVDRISGKAGREEKRWESIRVESLHEINRYEVERIQAKIADRGAGSLTPDERAFMNRMVD
jgi:membrane associated rhomboid family serine protease